MDVPSPSRKRRGAGDTLLHRLPRVPRSEPARAAPAHYGRRGQVRRAGDCDRARDPAELRGEQVVVVPAPLRRSILVVACALAFAPAAAAATTTTTPKLPPAVNFKATTAAHLTQERALA